MTLSVTNQYIDRGVFCAAEIMYLKIAVCHSLICFAYSVGGVRREIIYIDYE